jgi:hypothetical protein
MWVLKFHGETLYVKHVDCAVAWSTKETPDNSHTKGSIKVKDVLLRINDSNEAQISKLTLVDKFRLRNQKLGITRIMAPYGCAMHKALLANEYKHAPLKTIRGACSGSFIVTDLLSKNEVLLAKLKYDDWRELKPNESYYQQYDNVKGENLHVDHGHPSTPFEYS